MTDPKIVFYSAMSLYRFKYQLLEQVPGLENFSKSTRYVNPNSCILDRTGTIQIPFKTQITNPMPAMEWDFNLTYKECAMSRMAELDRMHQATGKTFRIMYSGGIDSTAIFASFIEYFGVEKASKLLEIYCSKESIQENPWAWGKFISPGKFKLKSSFDHSCGWRDENIITIMGEGHDHLMGGLGSGDWVKYQQDQDLYAEATIGTLIEYLEWVKPGKQITDAEDFAEKVMQVAAVAPFPVTNMYTLMWWYIFALSWEGSMLRILSHANQSQFAPGFLENNFLQFFNTNEFQQWSMMFHYKHPEEYAETKYCKFAAKDMVIDTLGIPEFANKNKFKSLFRILRLAPPGIIIDNNLKIYHDIDDYLQFVEPNNSFV